MASLSSIASCAKVLNTQNNNEHVIPNLLKFLKDKIPNVRFLVVKRLGGIGSYLDNTGKEKVKA